MRVFRAIGLFVILVCISASGLMAQTTSFEVNPEDELHFDVVPLGICEPGVVTITNTSQPGLDPIANPAPTLLVSATLTGDPDFQLIEGGVDGVPPGESRSFDVTFCPMDVGELTATLTIQVVNSVVQPDPVVIFGDGGEPTDPDVLVDMILDFFDQSVDAGELNGRGSNTSQANRRLRAMRNRIRTIDFLVRFGYDNAAIRVTQNAIKRSDGEGTIPPDFVEGDATEELNFQLEILLGLLGG